MHIGVIGAGHVGTALTGDLLTAGYDVAIANSRAPETLDPLVEHLGPHATAATAHDAAHYGPVVALAIPFGRYTELEPSDFAGRVVIDAMNYYPERDGHRTELDTGGTTSSELVQRHLPDARVVKAFNAIRADHLREYRRTASASHRYGIPVAGNDDVAKREVVDLIERIGFEAVDTGDLGTGGRMFQPGTGVYLADLTDEELQSRIGLHH
jgi:predicted dinucleotide-binding enzyme